MPRTTPTHDIHVTFLECKPHAPQSAGAEFDALSPEQQTAASKSLAVFARVEPLHKLRLVELLRDQVGIV
jgi:magnesium-transporting ATPase (P-type)